MATLTWALYFFGELVSVLGSWLQSVAQAWLVYRLTGSSLTLALVIFIGQAPLLFLIAAGRCVMPQAPNVCCDR